MAKMTDDQRIEKTIKKLHEVIAELAALDHPMWPDQMASVKKAVFALEERMANDRGMFHEPTNR